MNNPQMNASVIYMGKVVPIKELPESRYDITEDDRYPIALSQAKEEIPAAIIQYFAQRGLAKADISKRAVELNIRVKKSK